MKLKEILPLMTHQEYVIYVENSITSVFEEPLKLNTIEDIQNHMDFKVIAIDVKWNITIRGE